jgi:hypothetical protein
MDFFVQALRSHIAQNLSANAARLVLAVPFKQTHDSNLARSTSSLNYGLATILSA